MKIDGMDWQSPITVNVTEEFAKKIEDDLVSCVVNYGFNVDKDELAKALAYSKESYERGFRDAMAQCSMEPDNCRWYNAKKCVPPEDTTLLVTILKTDESIGLKQPYTAEAVYIAGSYIGRNYLGGHFVYTSDIVAWMLYPKPYAFEE